MEPATTFNVTAVTDSVGTSLVNATGVAGNTDVLIKFGAAFDPATVSATTITLKSATGVSINAASLALSEANTKVTFDPSVTLADNTVYTLTIAGVKDVAGNAATYTTSFTTGSKGIVTATVPDNTWVPNDADANPDVLSETVVNRATAASVGANLDFTFAFTKNVDTNTVNTSNVKLYNKTDARYVPITVQGAPTATGATFRVPVGSLVQNKSYEVQVSGIKTLDGQDVVPFKGLFAFADTAATASKITGPDNNATNVWNKLESQFVDGQQRTGFKYVVSFSRQMQAASVNGTNFELIETATDTVVAATVSFDTSSNTATLLPASDLKESTQYTVRVRNSVDTLGIPMTTFTQSFTTGEFTRPTITSTSIANGATNVATDATISVNFSEAINSNSVAVGNANAFTNAISVILVDNTNSNAAFDLTNRVSLTNGNKTLVVNPGTLVANRTYTLSINGSNVDGNLAVADLANNALAAKTDITFTTANPAAATVQTVRQGTTDINGTTARPANTDIDVRFSASMTAGDITIANLTSTSNIRLYNVTNGHYVQDIATQLDGAAVTTDTVIHLDSVSQIYTGMTISVGGTNATVASVDASTNRVALTAQLGANVADNAAVTWTAPAVSAQTAGVNANDIARISLSARQLAADKTYRLELTTGVRDANTNRITASNYTFTTGARPAVVFDNTLVTGKMGAGIGNVQTFAVTNLDGLAPGVQIVVAGNAAVHTIQSINYTNREVTLVAALGFDPADGADISIAASNPTRFATSIAVASDVTVRFSEVINAASVNADTVKLRNRDTAEVVAAAFKTVEGNRVVIDPTADLAASTWYEVVVDGVTDNVGNPVTATTYSFQTVDTQTPSVVSITPADGTTNVAIDGNFVVKFNRTMNAATMIAANVTLDNGSGDIIDANSELSYDAATNTLTIDPAGNMTASSNYALTLTNNIQAANGSALTAVTYNYRTSTGDTTAPKKVAIGTTLHANTDGTGFSAITPVGTQYSHSAAGATALTDNIVVAFDEVIVLTDASISVVDTSASNAVIPVTSLTKTTQAVGALLANQGLTIDTPTLTDQHNYKVTVTGVKDANGNTTAPIEFFYYVDDTTTP